jgi:NPL4 family
LSVGDKENQVHMEGYQVSAQCMALVRDNCLLPTKDAPELGYVRESTDKQYVPDVFFKVSVFIQKYKKSFVFAFRFFFFILLWLISLQ